MMRNFAKLSFPNLGRFVYLLKEEVHEREKAWFVDENRQKMIRVQQHTQSIFLRGADKSNSGAAKTEDVHPSRWTALATSFPETVKFLRSAAVELDAAMGRAVYVRLHPGNVVYPHIDRGAYYVPRHRYHLVTEQFARFVHAL